MRLGLDMVTAWVAQMLVVVLLLCILALAAGCMNLGGGRLIVATPLSKPNIVVDSIGVNAKNDRATGGTFAGAPGEAAAAAAKTGTADQIVQVGHGVDFARSTDASLAAKQSQAQGRQSGDQNDQGTKTLDDSAKVDVTPVP